MRADAKNLLERLGKQDFVYREFADRFSDLELWPMFEALLKDPRLFTQSAATQSLAGLTPSAAPAAPAAPAPANPASEPLSNLFGRYEAAPPRRDPATESASPSSNDSQDVRAMLQHLSELNEKGKI